MTAIAERAAARRADDWLAEGGERVSARAGSSGPVLAGVLERAADPDAWERFERQLRSTGYCRQPVRLRGRVDSIDRATGEVVHHLLDRREPDGTLLKCCGNRREAVCPSCARTYRGDAFQLVAAGMRGGKGVPETVAEHPLVFLTLTAPSFGPVHSRRVVDGKVAPLPAAPRAARRARTASRSPATRSTTRTTRGWASRSARECFDYEHAVLWNALAPELWRRTRNPAAARARAPARRQEQRAARCASPTSRSPSSSAAARCTSTASLRLDGVDEDGELVAPAARARHRSC